jgi:hypothetical protein
MVHKIHYSADMAHLNQIQKANILDAIPRFGQLCKVSRDLWLQSLWISCRDKVQNSTV